MQVFVGGGNAIFLLLTVLFAGFLALVALVAWRRKNQSVLRAATGVGVVVLGVYGAMLLSAAIASRERILAAGEVKWFCGFYLDCHLGVSVSKVQSARDLPHSSGSIVARGVFKIVTVELHNSAKNPGLDMTLYRPRAVVVDVKGSRYTRSVQAEQAIARSSSFAAPLKEVVSVGHAPLFATMVFDVPADAENTRLSIEEGFVLDRVIELVLVNDDNSVLHKPTSLALDGSRSSPPISYRNHPGGKFLRVRLASR